MAIKVSNGSQTFEVEESKLDMAKADGFIPTIKVSNGKDEFDVHPSKVSDAERDGFKPLKMSNPGVLETAARFGAQGATGGLADEAYGAARGFADDMRNLFSSDKPAVEVKRDKFGRIKNLDEINKGTTYAKHRDEWRERDKAAREANPTTAFVAEMAGGIASPLNKVTKGMNAVKGGATLGTAYGFGNSESDDLSGLAIDTTTGAVLGAAGGKVAEKVSPHIESGIKKGVEKVQNIKTKIGEKSKDLSEKWAFKSSGAMLKDWRNADDRDEINKIGRWILDKGLKAGDSVDDITKMAESEKKSAALILDKVYNQAGKALESSGKGFDPIRDKERIMAAARNELGDSVGGDSVLNQLSNYIDDLAAKHGDAPNDALRKQFQSDVNKYKSEYKNFLKEKREYQNAFGQAADEQQQVLNGFHDDSQRAVNQSRQVEVGGRPAEVMTPEAYEYGTQMGLFELPQSQQGQFNPMRGDDLTPLAQKMALDERARYAMTNLGQQGEIAGTGLVPRAVRQVDDVGVAATGDQLKMNFQPNAPTRPVKPQEVRNPMSPRRANEIKGAFDDQINYSRNPLTNEPNKERVYSGARRELNKIVLESIDSIDDKALGEALRDANNNYGVASKVSRIANDRAQRESANKFFGLTDNITGVGGVVASLMTGTPLTGLAMVGIKKAADKYGASTIAVGLDRLSKRLLKDPQMQRLAQLNPQQFNATVIRMFEALDARNQISLPRAAENDRPKKGPEKWVLDGIDKLNQAGIDQQTLESLRQTKQGRDLLIEASDASPGSKRMESVLRRIRTANQQGGQ